VFTRVSLTKSEVRREGGLCDDFKEAVDKAAPNLRAGSLACIRRPELFIRRKHSMDPFQSSSNPPLPFEIIRSRTIADRLLLPGNEVFSRWSHERSQFSWPWVLTNSEPPHGRKYFLLQLHQQN
jgi:hypothetical protein